MRRTIEARFNAKVSPEPNSGCHLWTGAVGPKGYGHLWVQGKMVRAHRLAWELVHGPIPEGCHVLHRCDQPLCLRPDHLFLGTNRDNVNDMMAKRRQQIGARNNRAILDCDAVRAIRRREKPQREYARQYGVEQTTISAVQRGDTWRGQCGDSTGEGGRA